MIAELISNHRSGRLDSMVSTDSVTTYHVQALKSLVTLLLQEVAFLESITVEKGTEGAEPRVPLERKLEQFEISLIRKALFEAAGNQVKAARILGVGATTLNAKLKRLGIDARVFGGLPNQDTAGSGVSVRSLHKLSSGTANNTTNI